MSPPHALLQLSDLSDFFFFFFLVKFAFAGVNIPGTENNAPQQVPLDQLNFDWSRLAFSLEPLLAWALNHFPKRQLSSDIENLSVILL